MKLFLFLSAILFASTFLNVNAFYFQNTTGTGSCDTVSAIEARQFIYNPTFANWQDIFSNQPEPWPTDAVCVPYGNGDAGQCCSNSLLGKITTQVRTQKATIEQTVETMRLQLKEFERTYKENIKQMEAALEQAKDQLGDQLGDIETFIKRVSKIMLGFAKGDAFVSRFARCMNGFHNYYIGVACMICDARFDSWVVNGGGFWALKLHVDTCDYIGSHCGPFLDYTLELSLDLLEAVVDWADTIPSTSPINFGDGLEDSFEVVRDQIPCGIGKPISCSEFICGSFIAGFTGDTIGAINATGGSISQITNSFGVIGVKRESQNEAEMMVDFATSALGWSKDLMKSFTQGKKRADADSNQYTTDGYGATEVGTSSSEAAAEVKITGMSNIVVPSIVLLACSLFFALFM